MASLALRIVSCGLIQETVLRVRDHEWIEARDPSPAPMRNFHGFFRNQPDSRTPRVVLIISQVGQSWFVSSITATISIARQGPSGF
jgi:hypothetical protein